MTLIPASGPPGAGPPGAGPRRPRNLSLVPLACVPG